MAEEHEICPPTEVEDGGVPLPNMHPEVDPDYEAASASSSTSEMFPASTYGADPWFNGSDTTLPPMTGIYDQQAALEPGPSSSMLPNVSEGPSTTAALWSETSFGSQAETPALEENEAFQNDELLDSNIGQNNVLMDSHAIHALHATDSMSTELQSNGGDTQNITAPTTASVLDEQDLDDSPPTSTLMSSDEEAPLLNVFQDYLPKGKNYDVDQFLQLWKQLWLKRRSHYPCMSDEALEGINAGPHRRPGRVSTTVMKRISCDIQGIEWSQYHLSTSMAREMRRMTSRNYINMPEIHYDQPDEAYATPAYKACFKSDSSPALSTTDDFFCFRETNLKHLPEFSHNQLRHCVSASSKNAVFFYNTTAPDYFVAPLNSYFGLRAPKVLCLSPEADIVRNVIDLCKRDEPGTLRPIDIACITASDGVLIVGALQEGHYVMKSLSNTCDDTYIRGVINNSGSIAGINHVHTFPDRRSGVTHAAFCDNDSYIRVIDCNTTQHIHARKWYSPVNCSATSPDGRLRIHVSDDRWPIVADAETGHRLARLPGHKDHGFACDWSPDGITMATGHQDGIVQVWDARKMNRAVHVLPAEMGGIRSLHFSPLGAGHPVLIMAEPIDFVSIVDARTFQSKQDIEFFGEISGVSMPPDGETLYIGNADPKFGGIVEFERTGYTGSFKHRQLSCSSLQQRKNQRRQAVYNASPDDSGCNDEIDVDDDDNDNRELVEEASPEAKLKRKWMLDDLDARIWVTREHDWAEDQDMNLDRRALRMRMQRWRRYLGLESMLF